ncbi:T9SS type B sorting domain-containing protein [Algibacter sp. L4_22]|uniref:T9SS type B sorting domain-containing protein n=1 Tax=Algibacter sp. L4_22 TaxID=2942477 RepID=UPI00201B83D5|nr:T9SS type B sorting domain-containing protein [Algibacter sp. L4_22]MCL5128340.1 T9SS type B sorting domain-containing protein [Algibacter sp. L4_22]
MKKTTYLNKGLAILLLLFSFQAFAQNYVNFTPRFDQDLKGDIVLIGNNTLGPDNNAFNNNSTYNHNVNMRYIDIDGDASTFSSTSADLVIPNIDCYKIIHAGLYWGAVSRGTAPITDIKFKGPEGGYNDITGEIIYDANGTLVTGSSYPYSCYADVTSIVTGITNNTGTYTVANVSSEEGRSASLTPRNGTGFSAGWSLFIVYEDPTLPGKSITSFDGFSAISTSVNLDIPISGFRTIPAPAPVRANLAFATLEGDKPINGDRLRINGSSLSSTDRNSWNFFNSSVTQLSGLPVNNRNPNSTNTLGFDTGIMNVPNPGNGVIANNATNATIRLESSGDTYFQYFFALAVEIIEPKIVLTKIVENDTGTNIGGEIVELGDQLNYVIGFQNTGNDNATEVIIRDILPQNIVFDYPADLAPLPPGVTVQSYDEATRELIFQIDESAVEENDPLGEIRFSVRVVSTCSLLSDACSNLVDNQAYATYNGTLNPLFTISDDPSFSENTGCLLNPKATNFLADINDCSFEEEVTLCGATTELVAADGYNNYTWSTSPSLTPVIGNTQSISVTETGTYYVYNEAVAPCKSINQVFNVVNFGTTVNNPVLPYADQVVICPNDGKELPNIFLCGANDSTVIQTGISDTSSMIWEKLDEASCDAVTNQDCANESDTCTWNQVETGPNFTADTAGQYRLTLNYTGGCFNQYYFNVYENILEPNTTSRDIFCTTTGEIVVGGVPSGYEYSIDGTNYQSSNVFPISTPDFYTVYIRQVGVSPNPCIFTVPDIQIRERDFTGSTIITQPLCYGDKGNINLAANDVRPQYFFTLYSGLTLVNSVGPINENSYKFENLNPGFYTVNVSSEDGCTFSETVEIINPPLLTATSALTTPLTCIDGEITVYPEGGTAPYFYFINSTTEFQSSATIDVTSAGVFDIMVVDSNNCSATTSITVEDIPAPVYTIAETDILCYGYDSGEIEFNVTNANGYTLEYSIDNGVTYVANPVFSNLTAGSYDTMVKYSLGTSECFTTPENITISQPDTALTASSGVSELAGCEPSGSGEGKVRITNPQGGTPPYEYSFDNQSTWLTTNEYYVLPGTYTLYIRDTNGCIYAMPSITLDPEPVAPTIDVSDPDFNCDGTADATVTVTNAEIDSFSYNYLLDGVENPNTADPTVFLNVPSGSHTVTVDYKLESVTTYSNLLYETFGYGEDTTSPGINPTYYCFERQVVGSECKGQINIQDGDYSVTAEIVRPYGTWLQPGDHTPATTPATEKGRSLVVNIGSSIPKTEILYEKDINDIIAGQPIIVELYAINLLRSGRSGANPDLLVALVDGSGTEISSFSTGEIPKSNQWENYPKTPMTLDPGSNTSLKFIIRSNVQVNNGNDVAIDDITVYQLPKSCVTEVEFPIVIDSGKAFTSSTTGSTNVTCNGASDGTLSIAAQNYDATIGFEYSIDNGTTWTTQMTSPYTITGLAADSYDVIVRYETCSFPFSETITAPALLEVSASGTPITCLTGSTVTATATGGTAGYTYELLDTATLNLVDSFPSNGILSNIPSGDYTIRATDSNDCVATTTLNLSGSAAPTASINTTSNFCYDPVGGGSLIVDALGGELPYEYSINSGIFQSSNTFTSLAPGNYIITVRDAYGCTVVLPAETIAPQISVVVELTKELDCTTSPDAEISGTISDGYAPYTVTLLQGTGTVTLTGNTFSLNPTTDGVYQFEVTDDRGCIVASNEVNVNPLLTPAVTATKTEVTCNTSADGTVTLTGSGGSGGYTYSDDNVTFTTNNTFSGLAAGTYSFYVKDSKDCSNTVSATITEPTPLVATASATTFSCSATNTKESAEITIALPTTGTATYQYSFNGGTSFSSTNTLTVNDTGADQTFSYVVKDANGCLTAAQDITITALDPPTDLDFTSLSVTCLATTTTVDLTATDGVGTLQYETIAPSPIIVGKQTSNSFAGLTPGTYVFQVTDANGCYYSESYTITPVTPIAVSGTLTSDVSCKGGDNGSGTYTVSGNATVGGYTFILTSGTLGTGTLTQTGDVLTLANVEAGTYTVEVTDNATGCDDTASITVNEPIDALTLGVTSNVNGNCDTDAQVTVTASGGTPGYSYAFVQDGTSPTGLYTFSSTSNLDPSVNTDWDVWVMDIQGCTTKLDIVVAADGIPTIDPVALECYKGLPISITLSGMAVGTPTYSIGGAFQASPIFTINAPGTYNLSIKDGNGCIASTTYVVQPELLLDANMTQDLTCTVDASITLTASGGTGTYSTYEVNIDGAGYNLISGSPYTATADGDYQFRVTDSQGCIAESNIIIVTPKTTPTLTFTQTNVSCNSSSDGSIVVTADSGIAPYEYSIDNGVTFQTSNVFNGLNPTGTYNIVVRDSKNCDSSATLVTITEPDALVATANATTFSCSATNTKESAEITIALPTTGTAPYQYSFNGGTSFSSTNTLTVNDTGADQTFSYVVKDANGCLTVAQDITITALDPPTDLDFSSLSVTCLATTTTVDLTATDGVGTLQYETIAPSPIIVGKQTSNSFAGLTPGTYVFQVTDANGCYYQESYTITPVTPIAVSGTLTSDVSCKGGNNGSGTYTISGNATVGDYAFILTSGTLGTGTLTKSGNVLTLANVEAGTYIVEVTDNATGCFDTADIIVGEPASDLSFATTSTNVFCTNDESQITVTPAGGTASYTYAAVVTGASAPVTYDASSVITVDTNSAANLSWDVYVKDANDCIEINPVIIGTEGLPTVTTPAIASNQCSVSTGFTFTATGTGLAPLTYSINGGASYQASSTFTVNTPGSYTVTIKDKNGCTGFSTTPIVVYAPLTANAILTKDLTCSMPTEASIDISASGGNGAYTYEVSTDGGSTYTSITGSLYKTSTAGTYQFKITDVNLCDIETNVITVAPVTLVTASETLVNPTCNGDTDGSIELTALTGEAPFIYSIDGGGSFVSSNTFGGLAAGTYNYVVRDVKGCEITDTVTLTSPAPIVPEIVTNGILCNSVTPGSFDVDITSGGDAPYVYRLFDNSFTEIGNYTTTLASTSFPHNFPNLDFGDYYITIVDARGCEFLSSKLRIEPIPYLELTSQTTSLSCLTGATVNLNVTGGNPNYTYSIYGRPGTTSLPTSSTSYTFANLDQNTTYVFEVVDSGGCPSFLEIKTGTISPITIDPIVATDVTCNGSNNGELSFTIGQYDASVTELYYEVRDNLTNVAISPAKNGTITGVTGADVSETITGLLAGNYTLYIKEVDGTFCSTAEEFQIRQPIQALSSIITKEINANCNSGAQLTLTTTGGTGPYKYAAGAPGFTPLTGDFGTSNVLNLDYNIRTIWDIVVEDANGCQFLIEDKTIIKDTDPTITSPAQQCFTGSPISITLSGTTVVSPVTYSIGTGGVAGAYQSSDTFTINAAGTYDVFIKDGNGCIASTTYVVQPELLLDADMTQDLTCTVDASITLTASGGTGTYSTYEVNIDGAGYNPVLSSPYTATVDGDYQFRVTDSQGCPAESNIIIVTPKTTPTFTHTQTNVSCNGGADGSIVITVIDGIAPYQYSIDNGATFQSSNVFNASNGNPLNAAGIYNVVVRDSKNCDSSATLVNITEPVLLDGTGDLLQGLTCGSGNATQAAEVTITAIAGTGTAPYTYSFDGVNYTSTNNYFTYTSGTVSAYIKDANGCVAGPIDVIVPALDPPTDLDFVASAVTCVDLTSDVQLTTTDGVGILSYEILSPATSTGNVSGASNGLFTGLAPDDYLFEVTDANGCTYQELYTVVPVTNIAIAGLKLNDVYCFGDNSGAIEYTVTGYAGTYTPTLTSGVGTLSQTGNTIDLTGLVTDTYTVRVTDDITGCFDEVDITIDQPANALTFTAAATHVYCTEDNSQITVTPAGGTTNYTYAAVIQGATAPSAGDYGISNIVTVDTNSGTDLIWDVYVKDANGCITTNSSTVILDPEPTVTTPALASNQCSVSSGFTFTATGASGVSPYVYSINGGASYQSSPTFTINTPGSYTVTIKDANGCTATSLTPTIVYEPLTSVPAVTKELDCSATPEAEITVTISGGNGPFTYTVQKGAGVASVASAPIAGPTFTYSVSLADVDSYTFEITDANSCTSTSTITVDPITNPIVTPIKTDVSCNGGSSGTVQLTGSGGSGGYTYSDDNVTFTTTSLFTGLAQGSYTFYVKDSKNCTGFVTVNITEPTALVATADATKFSCSITNEKQAAVITIDVPTTGTAPYQYSFNGGTTFTSSNTLTVNDTGVDQTFSYEVKDANGCTTGAQNITIVALDPPTDLVFTPGSAVTCLDTTGGSVTLTATDGVGILSYEIVSPASATGNISGASSGTFTGLVADTYLFQVTDANGCYYQESYTVPPVTNIAIAGLKLNDVYCFGDNTGAIQYTVTGYAGTYTYTLTSGVGTLSQTGNTIDLTGLVTDTYTVRVTDDITGCFDEVDITIDQPASDLDFTTTSTNVYCTEDNSQITVTPLGGTANYTYAAVVAGTTAPAVGDYITSNVVTVDTNSGTDLVWDVYVKDANGCTTTNPSTVILDPLPTVDVPTLASNQCNLTGDAYTFTVTNPTGVVPFEYSIGNGFQTGTTFAVSNAGTYSVTIKDGNGCTFTNATPITVYAALDVSSTIVSLPSCIDNDGEITVSGSGGSGNYTFSINPSTGITQTGNIFSGLSALTNYTVTVTDTVTTCTNTVTVNLEAATPVNFTATPIDVTCIGDTDGVITVNLDASNNNPLYKYAIIAGPATFPAQDSNIFTGLETGSYTVEVTSGRDCVDTEIVTVGTPTAIIVPAPTVQEYSCTVNTNLSNFATITVTGVSGGSGNFVKYEFIRDADGVVVQSNSSNVYTITNLLGGAYTVNVYDDNGCLGASVATVAPFISIDDLTITIDNAITCTNDEDITVSVTSTGGTPTNLQFTLEDIVGSVKGGVYSQTNATGVFTGLPIGNYLATVLNIDTGCVIEKVHYVNDPFTFDLTIDNIVDVTCFSDNDGSVDITLIDRTPNPTDESGAFSYELFDNLGNSVATGLTTNAGPVTITGLLAGTYSVTTSLTNAPYCTVNKNFTITAPTAALAIAETHTAITCVSGNNDGSISVSATGGWPGGYEYQLSNTGGSVIIPFGTESNFIDLSAGDYTVTARDSQGCEDPINVILVNPTPITIVASTDITTLNCFGDSNATISVTSTTGGQGSNYTYSLNMVSPTGSTSGPQTSGVFSGLASGTYNVTVTDGYNCSATSLDIIIAEPADIQASLVKSTSETCLISAALTLSATGGTGIYEYSNVSDFATVIGSFVSEVTFDAAPGTYMYYVRDANGCIANASNEIIIDPLLDLKVNLDTTNASINCSGDDTGVIIAKAEGGLGNYVYTLQDASGTDISPVPTQNSPGVFTNLPAGDYLIEVESGDCLEISAPVSISEPTNPLSVAYNVINVTCAGINNGILEINATGGSGIIKYAISPRLDRFFEDATFEDLAPGIYQAIVQDQLGCFVIIDFEVEDAEPVLLNIVPNSIFPAVCDGDMDGEFSVEISGGEMPYSVVLDDEDGVYTTGAATQIEFDFTGLEGGDHIVFVRDNLGCESEWNITFPESVLIDPQLNIEYGCVDNASSNTVTISVDESITDTSDLDYSLDGGLSYQASNIFLDVPAGLNHYVDVRHTNGCIKRTELFDISEILPLELAIEAGGLNEIVATATGGVEPYEFTLNGESYGSTSDFIYYESRDYTVTVTDRNGCIATATMYFEFIDVCITNYFTPNGDGVLDEWGPGCTSIYNDLTFEIFDRYGRVVAKLRAGQKWNGKYHGKELPTGDYWYVVKLNDSRNNKEFVGHFTLYR